MTPVPTPLAATLATFRKELLDGLRDRRSLVSALVFALVGPVVVAMALDSLARRTEEARPLEVLLAGAEHAPALVDGLRRRGAVVVDAPSPGAVDAAVRAGAATVGLLVPAEHPRSRARFRPAAVTVIEDRSRSLSREDGERLRGLLAAWDRQESDRRLLARGVSPRAVRPLDLGVRDLSTAAARAATALAAVPIFLLMATFVGGMNTAIDVTAGERERGSLEPLLLFPVPRGALAAGKWLAATALNLGVVAATVGAMEAVVRRPRLEALGLRLGEGASGALVALAVLLPLVLLAPALQMLASLFSRSFREAQAWVSMSVILPAVPGFVFAFRDLDPEGWMGLVPVLGHQLALSALLRGEALDPVVQLGLAAATVGLAAASVAGVGVLLGRERLVTGG